LKRIVIFSGALLYSVRKGIAELSETFPEVEWLVAEQVPNRSVSRLSRNQWRNLRRHGWRWVPYELKDVTLRLRFDLRNRKARSDSLPGSKYAQESVVSRKNVRYFRTRHLHAEDCLRLISEFQPDLGIALAAPILKPALFEIPRLGTINLHKGKLPYYRGMPPAFWEFYYDEREVGCTVHRVARGLDTGATLSGYGAQGTH
jgi:hypothetical protein